MKKLSHYFPHLSAICFCLFTLLISGEACAQQKTTLKKTENLQTVQLKGSSSLLITFNAPEEVANLLVLLVDEKGNTIFLDNKYRFKGNYRHEVDLKPYVSSRYQLQVRNDEDYSERNISMK